MPAELTLPHPYETRAGAAEGDAADADDWRLLVAAAGERPFAGIDTLFRRHSSYVFRLACGLLADPSLAEDVTQEVFLRMARGRRRWRPRARFRTWLYRLTVNTCREQQRRRHRDARLASRLVRERAGEETAPAADPLAATLSPALRRKVAELAPRQREVLVLRFFEELDTKETARVLGCRPGTVKAHLHRAMTALRQAAQEELPRTRTLNQETT